MELLSLFLLPQDNLKVGDVVPPARSAMMFPCSALPPPLYPGLLRPAPALSLPLHRSFHSGFLVEDLLRLSQPVSYIHRTFSSRGPGDILPLSVGPGGPPRAPGAGTERCVLHSSGSAQPASPDSGYLKFSVSAILAPPTRSGESEAMIYTYIYIYMYYYH